MAEFRPSRRDILSMGVAGVVTPLASGAARVKAGQVRAGRATAGRARTDDVREITYGDRKQGILDEDDPTSDFEERDYYVEPVEFEGAAGDSVSIALRSYVFGPYLRLVDPDGQSVATAGDDDRYVELETSLEKTGTYTINVTAQDVNATGEYTLSLARIQQDVREISYGQVRRGVVDGGDPESGFYRERTYYVEPIEFEGTRGDEVTVRMEMDWVGPFLRLIDPDGESVATDDDNDFDGRASISTTLEKTGTYTINARLRDSEETGWYRLILTGVPAETETATSTPSPTASPPQTTASPTPSARSATATGRTATTPTATTESDTPAADSERTPRGQRASSPTPQPEGDESGFLPLLLGALGVGGAGAWLVRRRSDGANAAAQNPEEPTQDVDSSGRAEVVDHLDEAERLFTEARDALYDDRTTVAKVRFRDAADAYDRALDAARKHEVERLDANVRNHHFEGVDDVEARREEAREGLDSAIDRTE